jgi:hypothetical protein
LFELLSMQLEHQRRWSVCHVVVVLRFFRQRNLESEDRMLLWQR